MLLRAATLSITLSYRWRSDGPCFPVLVGSTRTSHDERLLPLQKLKDTQEIRWILPGEGLKEKEAESKEGQRASETPLLPQLLLQLLRLCGVMVRNLKSVSRCNSYRGLLFPTFTPSLTRMSELEREIFIFNSSSTSLDQYLNFYISTASYFI